MSTKKFGGVFEYIKEKGSNALSRKSSNDVDYSLIKIKEGHGEAIIFIDGFLSEKKNNREDWESQLKEIYPDNPWYYVEWEADNLKAIGKQLGGVIVSRVIAGRVMASATPVGLPLLTLSLVKNPWSKAYNNAKLTGELLGASIITKEKEFILCGHSLGARVIYYALVYLVNNNKKVIKDVHLLGGAVDNKNGNWHMAKEGVYGSINNYISLNDKVLSRMYKVGTAFMSNPIGINNIDIEEVNNIDVSHIVDSHTTYKENFSKFVRGV